MSEPKHRVIVHADLDAFYASVEQRDNPDLRGKPIAVGGSPDHRGVVMTASYEARRFGVHSAMPCRTARSLCPQLIFVPPHFNAYQEASRRIMHIFRENTTAMQPLSLDEAFLDVSESVKDFEQATGFGASIKAAVQEATSLTASLGIAGCRLVAKIASDYDKPDGLTVVAPDEARAFLAPMAVRRLWGIGPKTEAGLRQAGIERIGQLADAGDEWIFQNLGAWGMRWRLLARGIDDSEVESRGETKQISREMTFDRDTRNPNQLRETLSQMAERLATALDETGAARTVHIKIRYANFETITRQRRGRAVTEASDIRERAIDLLSQSWDGKAVRLIGLGLSNFVATHENQLRLFEE